MAAQQVLPSVQIRVVVGPLGRYSESTNIPLPGSMAKKNVDFSASLQPLRKGRTKAPMHHVWRALCNMLASETFSPELRAILSEDYAATMAVRWDIHNMTIQCSKGEGSEWLDGAPEFVGFVREFQEAHRLGYPLLESEYMEPTVFSVALKKSMDGVGDRWSEQEARPETHYSLQIYIPTLEIDETLRTLMVPYGISGSSAHTSTIDASDVGMDDRQGRFIPGIPTSNIHQPLYSTTYPESTSVNTPPPSAKLLYNSKDTIDPRIISNPFYQIDEEQTNTINESLAFSSPPLQFQQLSSPILHRVAGDASSSSSSSRQHIPSSPTASLSAAVSGAPSTSIERPLAQPSQLHFWDLLRRTEQQYTFMFYSRDDQELLQKGQKIILVMNLLVELGFDLDADPDTAIAIEGLPYGPKLSMRRVLNSLRYCRYSFFKWRTMILWISDITTIDFTDLNPNTF
ncbi:hypothetical protein SISSUDRAFT_1056418 [Sistotremastrum suecicum HHB10207 ss-3]|uniref:Uncharacterized protein n=1 Tax=Sistotremastrum suecicum HHB10207 ss-3 TaxID=1314776 RepID=A0A165WWZ0_9AGAM|nr:hypothetical protein SISSUDRAFT_1056418 [Sistotremastrum suecicum HHB10207 ss-3]